MVGMAMSCAIIVGNFQEEMMDPNETLRALRELVEQVYGDDEGDVNDQLEDFAGYFESLDGWISKGGFLPRDWRPGGK
jgi:hypothetical protein